MFDSLDSQVVAMSVSRDDKVLAAGDDMDMVHLFDLIARTQICQIKSVGNHIRDIHMEDSQSVVVGFEDHLAVFDKEGKPIKGYDFNEQNGKMLGIRKKENLVLISTRTGNFCIFDILSDEAPRTFKIGNLPEDTELSHVAFDVSFTRGMAGTVNGELFSLDTKSGHN